MKKIMLCLIFTLGTVFFLVGCSQSGQSEQEKYYKQVNEDRKKAEEINKEAADSLMKMKKAPLYDNAENNPASNSNNTKK